MPSLRELSSHRVRVATLLLPLLVGALTACTGAPSSLAPASQDAARIAELFWSVVGIALAIFVVTEFLLIYALVRFRSRPGSAEPVQVHGNVGLETAWTLAPALILAGVFVATVSTMGVVAQQPANALKVKVTAHQWWWEVQYPDLGITTATDLHVPVGQPVDISLASVDVIHSFWVPELAGKTDVIPGHDNHAHFTADRPGTYRGECAEFCGTQHAHMGFNVIAEPRDQFDAWVQQARAPAMAPAAGPAAEGAQAFLSGPCIGCHTIDGTSATFGKTGPNLTHFASRPSIAALTIDNTPGGLAAWLSDPQALKPGNVMPNLHLSAQTIQALAAYLETLK